MDLGATSTPADPWLFLAVVLAGMVAVGFTWTYVLLRSDRRRAVGRGVISLPPWAGDAVEIRVAVDVPDRSLDQMAAQVIRLVGGTEVRVVEGRGAIGWLRPQPYSGRIPLSSYRQGYELGIAFEQPASNGTRDAICAARPQRSVAVAGTERTAGLASELADAARQWRSESR